MTKLNKIIVEISIPDLLKTSFKMYLMEASLYPDAITDNNNWVFKTGMDQEKKEARTIRLLESTVQSRLKEIKPNCITQLKLFEA